MIIPPQSFSTLTVPKLTLQFKHFIQKLKDPRTGKNRSYSFQDIILGAFSVFFTQSPSFLAHQQMMLQSKKKCNAQSLFRLQKIPTDNHIRTNLARLLFSSFLPFFYHLFSKVEKTGYLESYRVLKDQFLIAMDGVEYFSSETIHCKNCSVKNHRNGTTTYSHTTVAVILLHPEKEAVFPLQPEPVFPQDGHLKQDCEIEASKRWLEKYGSTYSSYGVTLLGDDLYSRTPFIQEALKKGFNFILVAQEESHTSLYQGMKDLEELGILEKFSTLEFKGKKKIERDYRYVNQIALYEGITTEITEVNCFEMEEKINGKRTYKGGFVTNHRISKKNIEEMGKAGRGRWKIENENNNTLKTQGYHLEHNFGHGENLSFLLLTLNFLAFFFHTILSIMDRRYQLIREYLGARETFFNDVKTLLKYRYFEDWNALFDFMIKELEIEFSDSG